MERFLIRPGYQRGKLLIQFLGNHRSPGYPDVPALLAQALGASPVRHPLRQIFSLACASGERVSYWRYPEGEYEIDDDEEGLFILSPRGGEKVIRQLALCLMDSGHFRYLHNAYAYYAQPALQPSYSRM